MKKSPKVAIITPSYNSVSFINETAQSVFRQTYSNWEWIIVDDGSTDDTWRIITSLHEKDRRVSAFKRNREPKGSGTCRNIGVEKSDADLLIFLDTDDLLASFCLEQRVSAFLENENNDLYFFPLVCFKSKFDDLSILWNVENDLDDIDRIIMGDPLAPGSGVLWNRLSFIDIGGWNESLFVWQDVDLHLRSFIDGMKVNKRMDLKPDIYIRVVESSISRSDFHSLTKLESRLSILTSTLIALESRGIVNKYRKSLRIMMFSIYKTSVQTRSGNAANRVVNCCFNFSVISTFEFYLLKFVVLYYLLRLYRLKFANGLIQNIICTLEESVDVKLCSVRYEGRLVL